MTLYDPDNLAAFHCALKIVRIIWYSNFISILLIASIIYNIKVYSHSTTWYEHAVMFGLSLSEIIITFIMRNTRFRPNLIKMLDQNGIEDVIRNFRLIEIISIALIDSVLIYGIVDYFLVGDSNIFIVFAVINILALILVFPREELWIKKYNCALDPTLIE